MSTLVDDVQRLSFGVKFLTDAVPTSYGIINPSVDCRTDNTTKYRTLMTSLGLSTSYNVAGLAVALDPMLGHLPEFVFSWGTQKESASYEPFQEYLASVFGMYSLVLADGKDLPEGILFSSDVYTLRSRELKKADLQPTFRFRIRGRTDIGVFNPIGVISISDLHLAIEIKTKKAFTSISDINRALREGVLQLIGSNTDNQFRSPLVIVSSLVGDQHFLLYIDMLSNPENKLRYKLVVRSCTSLSSLIQFAASLFNRGCVTQMFGSPPTPICSPHHTPENDEDDACDGDNASLLSVSDIDVKN